VLGLNACKKNDKKPIPPSDYPKNLSEIIDNKTGQAKLREMLFYDSFKIDFLGSGTFITNHICKYDNTIGTNISKMYANYQYTLQSPNQINYQSLNSNENSTFIDSVFVRTNRDNGYTIFFRAEGTTDGVSYKSLRILSGTRSSNTQSFTLENTYDCFIMLETGPDPDDKVADVGTIRVFAFQ
jgi:hypothetical protein